MEPAADLNLEPEAPQSSAKLRNSFSFLLLVVRHLLLVAMHLFLVAFLFLVVRHLLLVAMHLFLVAFLFLVVMPFAPSSFLLLVMPL